jgi:signal transduction histidine kinase
MLRHGQEREGRHRDLLDEERRLRYELERTKAMLLRSNAEVANIAEVKERNRLARDIHDSVGHSLAGNLIQLQAAAKLLEKDSDKAKAILGQSIQRLADTVGLLRDTVHNMKPREQVGIGYVKNVLDNFSFCPIDFSYSGDFNSVPSTHLETLTTCLKQALTNAANHSRATQIQVTMETAETYSRLMVKDNGVGCAKIKEGLGLSGMRERVTNLGGHVSVHAEEGFLVVCFLPRRKGI